MAKISRKEISTVTNAWVDSSILVDPSTGCVYPKEYDEVEIPEVSTSLPKYYRPTTSLQVDVDQINNMFDLTNAKCITKIRLEEELEALQSKNPYKKYNDAIKKAIENFNK